MNIPIYIATRYLFARKSHNVINIISAISAIGMAIGTAALIIILSVYNGFDSLVKSMMSSIEPDLLITPAQGKVFIPEGEAYDWLYGLDEVKSIYTVLQETVFIDYNGHQCLAKAKGVDQIYEEESPLVQHISAGSFNLHRGDVPLACVGAGLAAEMGIHPRFVAPVEIYYPSRTKNISLANPVSAVRSSKVYPSGIFSINNEIDKEYLIVPIDIMRDLLQYHDEVSAVEIRMQDGTSAKTLNYIREELQKRTGDRFTVRDRFRQNESLYKMMRYEKLSVYLILIFVIIIVAFNIFGSLTMLIIEKRDDIATLHSMGADNSLVRRIFVLEGWMVSLTGLMAGIIIGTGFALLQQKFGFIPMPGNFVVQAYPVVIKWEDIALTTAGVAIIGYLIALFSTFYKKRDFFKNLFAR